MQTLEQTREFGQYIGGQWRQGGPTFETRNPATGEVVGRYAKGSAADVDAAVQAAARAGGTVVRRPAPTPLGGSYGFFADPDGHLWEVIHHPRYRLGADGRPQVP